MKLLPLFFDINSKLCLVVGAGRVATRKIELLLAAGASVRIVAKHISAVINEMVDLTEVEIVNRGFQESDLKQVSLVIAASDDAELNRVISELADSRNIPVNVVDNPALCSFIMPSIIDRELIQIAITCSGASPVLARLLKSKIEKQIPANYGEIAKLVNNYRREVKNSFPDSKQRRRFWEFILDGPVVETVLAGEPEKARAQLEKLIKLAAVKPDTDGELYLVGAGPGDPDLLTLKASRLMQKCEVVVYDSSVSNSVLNMVRRDAEKICLDSADFNSGSSDDRVNQLLVGLVSNGKRVLRLVTGDPFNRYRSVEEFSDFIDANINFQVVPGISWASGGEVVKLRETLNWLESEKNSEKTSE